MGEVEKLRWRCRRGSLELDLMLCRYLDELYPAADKEEQALFAALLDFQDTELLGFFLGNKVPGLQAMTDLVEKIRCLSPD